MIHVRDISYAYGLKNVIDEISFSLGKGEMVAILGNNGAGKSTLLKCLDGIYRVKNGSILLNGEDVLSMKRRFRAKRVAYVAQQCDVADVTVRDMVLLGRKPYITWDANEQDHEIVDALIEKLSLGSLVDRQTSKLSGGELQKVMLARALAQQPELLLLDEPTSNLDPRNQHEVMRLVKDIAEERGIAVVIVLHDINLALRYCDSFLLLKDQTVYSFGGADSVNEQSVRKVFDLPAEIREWNGTRVVIPYPA